MATSLRVFLYGPGSNTLCKNLKRIPYSFDEKAHETKESAHIHALKYEDQAHHITWEFISITQGTLKADWKTDLRQHLANADIILLCPQHLRNTNTLPATLEMFAELKTTLANPELKTTPITARFRRHILDQDYSVIATDLMRHPVKQTTLEKFNRQGVLFIQHLYRAYTHQTVAPAKKPLPAVGLFAAKKESKEVEVIPAKKSKHWF